MTLEEYLNTLPEDVPLVFKPRVGKYINLPISFDIETSSTVDSCGNKIAFMYIWMFDFNGKIIMGRTWEEFAELYLGLVNKYHLSSSRRMVIYVHNLAYEFQFISHIFEWKEVFSLKERKPVYAVTLQGVEFRCSYILSNKSLAEVGKSLLKYKVEKKVGDLDYKLIRHSSTPLTQKEIGYCENDVKVVVNYIKELLEKENITKIPYTNTGYVRRACKENCAKTKSYFRKMKSLSIEPEEYVMLKRSFAGGFTHANANHTGKVIENVGSYDLTSAYPAVMLMEKFPMSAGEKVTVNSSEEFLNYIKKYNCLFEISFEYLTPKVDCDHYLSVSKCTGISIEEDNGRIVSARKVTTTITEIDYQIIEQCYSWDSIKIGKMYIYRKGYLPKEIILSVLEFYKKKTELKGIKEQEEEYQRNKGMLNSIYGMCVTDINKDKFLFENDEWKTEEVTVEEGMESYNKSNSRFIHYPWGVWITAYNRRNLWSAIIACGDDYIYSDTDSGKIKNYENHKEFFEKYNQLVEKKLRKLCEYYDLDWDDFQPKDKNGKRHLIGVFDFEGVYLKFKTLGAKRYMVMQYTKNKKGKRKKEITMTVSGVNKKIAMPYLLKKYGSDVFEYFNDGLVIPAGHTGKNIHAYIDNEIEGEITDYLGNVGHYHEYSYIHLEESEYNLSLSEKYINYLKGLVNPNM